MKSSELFFGRQMPYLVSRVLRNRQKSFFCPIFSSSAPANPLSYKIYRIIYNQCTFKYSAINNHFHILSKLEEKGLVNAMQSNHGPQTSHDGLDWRFNWTTPTKNSDILFCKLAYMLLLILILLMSSWILQFRTVSCQWIFVLQCTVSAVYWVIGSTAVVISLQDIQGLSI